MEKWRWGKSHGTLETQPHRIASYIREK